MIGRLSTYLLTAGLVLAGMSASADRLYRYINNKGVVVFSTTIPREYTQNGYEIIDANGMVREVVAPQMSPEEFELARAEREAAQKKAEQERRVRLLYGSPEDIDFAEEIKLHQIDEEFARGKADVARMRVERTQLEAQAAADERSGATPSGEIISTIKALTSRIDDSEVDLQQLDESKTKVRSQFARDSTLR